MSGVGGVGGADVGRIGQPEEVDEAAAAPPPAEEAEGGRGAEGPYTPRGASGALHANALAARLAEQPAQPSERWQSMEAWLDREIEARVQGAPGVPGNEVPAHVVRQALNSLTREGSADDVARLIDYLHENWQTIHHTGVWPADAIDRFVDETLDQAVNALSMKVVRETFGASGPEIDRAWEAVAESLPERWQPGIERAVAERTTTWQMRQGVQELSDNGRISDLTARRLVGFADSKLAVPDATVTVAFQSGREETYPFSAFEALARRQVG